MLSFTAQETSQKIYALRRALRIQPEFPVAQTRLNTFAEQTVQLESFAEKTDIPIDQKLSDAQSYLDEGDLPAAQNILREILRADPDHGQAWYLLSFAAPNNREKINALRQALRVDPGYQEAQMRLDAASETRKLWTLQSSGIRVQADQTVSVETPNLEKKTPGTLARVAKYSLYKGILLFFTVVVGIYITILIANLGGYIDEIFKGQIALSIAGMVQGGWLDDVPQEEKDALIEQTVWQMEENMGLHEPFILRTFRWLIHGLTLNLGDAYLSNFFRGIFRGANQAVQTLVLERLPYTILLVGVSNFLFFFVSVFAALFLSRHYGGILDRMSVILASLMSAPSWIFGILIIVVLAGELQILDFPKTIDLQYAEMSPEYLRLLLSQMVMPVMAIFLSVIFTGIFTWRTFFLLYSGEDYVEMARAQGLSNRVIERRYILRPSMPYVITSFAMMMIVVWESSIALEVLFNWPGIGALFYQTVTHFNQTSTQLIIAIVVVFAYLLAITVFLLDIVYAFIDPRVRVESNQKLRASEGKRKRNLRFWRRTKVRTGQSETMIFPKEKPAKINIPAISISQRIRNFFKPTGSLRSTLREVTKYPSAVVGLIIILVLIGVSIFTMITIPYAEAASLWQTHNPDELGRTTWYQNPHNARPTYVNLFRLEKLPETIIRDSRAEDIEKSTGAIWGERDGYYLLLRFRLPLC